jgi:hypothetical protein
MAELQKEWMAASGGTPIGNTPGSEWAQTIKVIVFSLCYMTVCIDLATCQYSCTRAILPVCMCRSLSRRLMSM